MLPHTTASKSIRLVAFALESVQTDRAVWRYYLYRCLSTLGLLNPFLVLFLLDRGISFTAISVAASSMALTTVLLEVPSGYLGDRLGRRQTLLIAKVATALGASLWFFVDSLATVVVVQTLNGAGVALKSGSDSAWVYEVLEDTDRAFTDVRARAQSLSQWTYGLTGIVGAVVYLTLPWVAFLLAAVGAWLAAALVWTFPRDADYRDEDGSTLSPTEAASATASFLRQDATRSLVLIATVYAGVMYTGSQFVQPLVAGAIPGGGLTAAALDVPEVVFLALLYGVLAAGSAIVVDRAGWLEDRLGTARAVVGVYLFGAVGMLLPAIHPVFVVPAVLAFRTVPSVAAPIRNGYLHDHADAAGRATEMSAVSFLYAVARVPVLLVAGRVADVFSVTTAFVGLGAYAVLAIVVIVAVDRPLVSSPPAEQRGATVEG